MYSSFALSISSTNARYPQKSTSLSFIPISKHSTGLHCHFLASKHKALQRLRRALGSLGDDVSSSPVSSSSNNGSVDEAILREEINKIEIKEPEIESEGENAALNVAAATAFGAAIWAVLGKSKGEEFFAGYLLEQSLSIDNLFVFILVFNYFKTPIDAQKTVLTYGIATAAILRLVLIVLGADIVESWKPVMLIFSAILLYSSFKLLVVDDDDDENDLANNSIVKFCRSAFTFTDNYDGTKFFTTLADGTRAATPLLLVLLVIELSDVVFAVDSIPAVFGVTLDPLIVYTSNMFAILSLRGLYSFVASFMSKLQYLDKAVAIVLGFIGAKIIAEYLGLDIPTDVSLAAVAAILSVGVGASLLLPVKEEDE